MAFLSSSGYIDDFSIDGPINKTFPKLQNRKLVIKDENSPKVKQEYISYYYGLNVGKSLYIISTNPSVKTMRYFIYSNHHTILPESQIFQKHFRGKITGIQVGDKFWVFGGRIIAGVFPQNGDDWKLTSEVSRALKQGNL